MVFDDVRCWGVTEGVVLGEGRGEGGRCGEGNSQNVLIPIYGQGRNIRFLCSGVYGRKRGSRQGDDIRTFRWERWSLGRKGDFRPRC